MKVNPSSNASDPLESQRGFLQAKRISKTSPLKKKVLDSLHGVGNVIVVDVKTQVKESGSLMSKYSNEAYSPLFDTNLLSGTSSIISGNITLWAPLNLVILGSAPFLSPDGTSSVNVTIGFDPVMGVTDYEIMYVDSITSSILQSITGLSVPNPSSGVKVVVATWNKISNANNYEITATISPDTLILAESGPLTSGTGTITVPYAGTYTITVTPYNDQGIAGIPTSVPVVVS